MKVMTILGTRPEIIRLSRIIALLDEYADSHILVHTGQNYDRTLSDIFFEQMEVRQPDEFMGVQGGSFGEQIGRILEKSEELLRKHRPDRLLILGDTNSGLSAIIARRLGIPVYHMEAGNRCYDDRVPEEVNRRIIDQSSTVLMPYTHRSKENLFREGFPGNRVYVIGNPIKEVIDFHAAKVDASDALETLGVEAGKFFLVTAHRAENVDIEERLRNYVDAFQRLSEKYGYPVIISTHPRTRNKIEQFGVDVGHSGLRFMEPFGFFDFIKLEKSAFCLLSDSGTVQEEGCIFGVPNVTIRDVTERPETLDSGSNIIAGNDPDEIVRAVDFVTSGIAGWVPPTEYMVDNVSSAVLRLLLGYRLPNPSEVGIRK